MANICNQHHLQRIYICLNKSCSDSFSIICQQCCRQSHHHLQQQLLTIHQFIRKYIQHTPRLPNHYEPTPTHNITSIIARLIPLSTRQQSIMHRQLMLISNNQSLISHLTTIAHTTNTINRSLQQIKSCEQGGQLFQGLLMDSYDYLEYDGNSFTIVSRGMEATHNELEHLARQSSKHIHQLAQQLLQLLQQLTNKADHPQPQQLHQIQLFNQTLKQQLQHKLAILAGTHQTITAIQQNYRNKLMEICEEVANIKCELQQLTNTHHKNKEQLLTLIQQQVYKYHHHNQHLDYAKSLLSCEDDHQIIPKIQQFISQFDQLLTDKNNILEDYHYLKAEYQNLKAEYQNLKGEYTLLKSDSDQSHNNRIHNLAMLAGLEEKNKSLFDELEKNKQINLSLRRSLQTINKNLLDIIYKNQDCNSIITQLNHKIIQLEKSKHEHQEQINRKNIQIQAMNDKIKRMQGQLKNSQVARDFGKSEQDKMKLCDDNFIKQLGIKSLACSFIAEDKLTELSNNQFKQKTYFNDGFEIMDNSLIRHKINQSRDKKPKGRLQLTIDNYKNEAGQKLNLMRKSIQIKQKIILTQRNQILKLSSEKNKSKDNASVIKQKIKIKQTIKEKDEIISNLQGKNKQLEIHIYKQKNQINQKEKQIIKLEQYIKFLEKEKYQIVFQVNKKTQLIKKLQQQLSKTINQTQKERKNEQNQTYLSQKDTKDSIMIIDTSAKNNEKKNQQIIRNDPSFRKRKSFDEKETHEIQHETFIVKRSDRKNIDITTLSGDIKQIHSRKGSNQMILNQQQTNQQTKIEQAMKDQNNNINKQSNFIKVRHNIN